VFTVKGTELEAIPFWRICAVPVTEPAATVATTCVSVQLTTVPHLLPKRTLPEPCALPNPEPVIVTCVPAVPKFGDTPVIIGALFTVSVKLCTALLPTPLLAVNVREYVLFVPVAGVPLSAPVPALNVTPDGSEPVSVRVGVGEPVTVTGNDPAAPTVKVALFALVNAGATLVKAKYSPLVGWPLTVTTMFPVETVFGTFAIISFVRHALIIVGRMPLNFTVLAP